MTSDTPVQVDSISLDFLATPSHPEMLGRIGRYDVERLVGAGGMGIVFKAFDTELHRPVAVKVLAPHLAHSGGARQRFAREAQSAAAVVHHNVVPIHNVDTEGKLPFLVMQYVAGESLQARVDRHGPLSTREVLRIGIQIADGLAAAHEQGLVHRDVKPGNILLEESVDRVLISDFGLARAADDASVTRSGLIAGTPHYMSPEQARGKLIDTRSDLFSLGSVMYFMCTGRPPFRAEGAMAVLHRICHDSQRPVDEVNDQVPAALADLIDRLLRKDPARRHASAGAVGRELVRQLQDPRLLRRSRKQRRLSIRKIGWTMAVLVVAAIASWHVVTGPGPRNPIDNLPVESTASELRPLGPNAETDVARRRSESSRFAVDPQSDRSNRVSVRQSEHRMNSVASQFGVSESPAGESFSDELRIFADESFFHELVEIEAELATFQSETQSIDTARRRADDDWTLEIADRMLDAIESGIDELEIPLNLGE